MGSTAEGVGPIYVGGYLALFDEEDEGELRLTRAQAEAALPPASPLPINIDHIIACRVGVVLALSADDTGLFFVGVLNCPPLNKILSSAVRSEFFGDDDERLTDEERLLYLINNYLPSASLSSRRLTAGEAADDTLLAHVALCVIGRRVGTIVVYDVSPDNVLGLFEKLDNGTRARLLSQTREAELALPVREWPVPEHLMSRALLSTAINNMLLRDKWDVVSRRRRQAGIAKHTYLQASAVFHLKHEGAGPGGHVGAYKDPARAPNPILHFVGLEGDGRKDPAPRLGSSGCIRAMSSAAPTAPAPSVFPAPSVPGGGDYVFVPTTQYNQLVLNQARAAFPPAFYPHPPPMTATAPSAYTTGQPYAFVTGPPQPPLESQLMALADAIADRARRGSGGGSGGGGGGENERRGTKRRRNHEETCSIGPRDGDDAYYPGEGTAYPGDGLWGPPGNSDPSKTLAKLVSVVSSLQQEVTQLRAHGGASAQGPVYQAGPPPHPPYGAYPHRYPVAGPGFPPPAHFNPYGQVPQPTMLPPTASLPAQPTMSGNDTGTFSVPPQPLPPPPPQQAPPPQPHPQQAPPPQQQQQPRQQQAQPTQQGVTGPSTPGCSLADPYQEHGSSAPPALTTIDAAQFSGLMQSNASTSNNDVDMFVSQIMSGRP